MPQSFDQDLSWSVNLTQGRVDLQSLDSILGHILLDDDVSNDSNNDYNNVDNDTESDSSMTTRLLEDLIYNNQRRRRVKGGEDVDLFGFVVEGVLLTLVSLFGLVGNVVSIVVLSRPVMKGSFSTLLIGLASFDMLYLTIGLAIFGLPSLSPAYRASHTHLRILQSCYGLGHIGRVGSVFVTTSVTIERYFALVHPLKHFRVKKYLLLVSAVVAVVYNVPRFFEMERKVDYMIQ